MSSNSNEKQIREVVKEFLAKHHSELIVDEFTGGGMKRRPDLTCITDEHIIMVEIKSDKDTFTRLEQQILEYIRYSNHVYVVIDISHQDKLKKFIDSNSNVCWMVDFVIFDNGRLLHTYSTKEDPIYYNFVKPRFFPFNMDFVSLLWAEETRRLLYCFKGYTRTLTKVQEDEALYCVYTPKELIELTFEIVKNRWEHISKQDKRFCKGYQGGERTSQIKHMEYKQLLFNDFLVSIGKKPKEQKKEVSLFND